MVHMTVIERCHKETENVIQVENADFIRKESISFLKKNPEQFIFLESNAFEENGIEGMALELDDIFQTYTALFGLRLQKKMGPSIRNYLDTHLVEDEVKYSILFSGEDGLWDMNIPMNRIKGFSEELSIEETVNLVTQSVKKLVETVKDEN